MYNERKKGIACSVALHLLLLLLLIFGLPSILRNEPPPEPTAITVELLPISQVSNVKPIEGTSIDKPKPEEPKPEPEKVKPSPPVKTSEPTPPPPPPEPKPEIKKPEPKKPEPKPEPKKEKPKKAKEEDLKAILQAVKDDAAKESKDKKEKPKDKTAPSQKVISSIYDPSKSMAISEKDAIMGQLARCWSPPAGAKNAQDLVVVINAEFNPDGSVIRVEIADESKSRYNSDSFFRAAADAAVRAVKICSPLKSLDPSKYDTWRAMELHFDPRDMLQ